MKASIVIPNLNGAGWLRDSIESIWAQTEQDFELIIIDNGSTDESLAIARSYVGRPGYTLVENQTNTGFSAAVNTGIGLAKGEYVVLFNNDAFAQPDWLAQLIAMADAEPRAFAVQSLMIRHFERDICDDAGDYVTLSGGRASGATACTGGVIQSRGAFFPPAEGPACTAKAFWMR